MLQVLDVHWKEHLAEIDHLRNSVGLRAYAQKNPKNEFKREAFLSLIKYKPLFEPIRILFSYLTILLTLNCVISSEIGMLTLLLKQGRYTFRNKYRE